MSIYFEIISYISAKLKRRIILIVPLLGIAGVLEVASLVSLIPLISVALDPLKAEPWLAYVGLHGLEHYHALSIFALVTFVAFSLKATFILLVNRYSFYTALGIRAFFQKLLFKSYLSTAYSYHLKRNTAEYLRNITNECYSLEGRFLMPVLTLMAEIIPVMFIAALLAAINPSGLMISIVIFVFFGFLITKFTAKRLRALGAEQIRADGKLLRIAQQSFHSPKEVYVYNRRKALVSLVSECADKASDAIAEALTLNQLPRFFFEIISLLVVIAVAAVSLYSGSSVDELIVELGVFFGAVVKLLPSSNRIVNHLQALNHSRPTIQNILKELKSTESAIERIDHLPDKDIESIGEFESIQVNNLGFCFDPATPLFENLNFEIKKGEVIGLIGETGSGKTTLMNVLLGLIPHATGEVLINGRPMQAVKAEWNKMVGYVPQEIYLLDDSLINNITFFGQEDKVDLAFVQHVVEQVALSDVVEGLDMGLETIVGEHGSRFSGGQRQRVAIARALYRDPDVLIFDEATSALDSETEAVISQAVQCLKGKKTIIMIAHRVSSLSVCDRVLKLERGNLEPVDLSRLN